MAESLVITKAELISKRGPPPIMIMRANGNKRAAISGGKTAMKGSFSHSGDCLDSPAWLVECSTRGGILGAVVRYLVLGSLFVGYLNRVQITTSSFSG